MMIDMDENIPGYTVISRIGEGGMATVYLAYQQSLERRVALKILPSARAADPAFCERFLRESKIGANLFHRNIVPVYEGGRFNSLHYLVMEYLPKGDFKHRLEHGCDTSAVLKVVYDVACALAYVHSKSYIHRDIKPDNILFREDQSAVLTDFGIALDMKSNTRGKPASRLVVGSPQYMSPEQARGDVLDYRADIYSLGVVLYEALARRPLFESPATVADAVRHSRDPVPSLPAKVSWLQPVLEKMLTKDRNDRFGSMDEVIRALEPCLIVPTFGWGMPPHPPMNQGSSRPLSSSPTLVEDSLDNPASTPNNIPSNPAPALTPTPAPIPARTPKAHRKSRVGILLLMLGLAALPLAYRQWPSSGAANEERAKPMTGTVRHSEPVSISRLPEIAKQSMSTPLTKADNAPESKPTSDTGEHAAEQTGKVPQTNPQPEPTATSAYEKYLDILSRDPDNQAARNGLLMITINDLDLASQALNRDNLNSAQQYVDHASAIATRYHLGSALSERIANQQYMLNRIRYLDAHKGPDSGNH